MTRIKIDPHKICDCPTQIFGGNMHYYGCALLKLPKIWEEDFDDIRNDGEHATLDDGFLDEFQIRMLKDIINTIIEKYYVENTHDTE